MADGDHHVYVLECADGSLYTGYTTDVERRVAEHDAGDGAKYTRGRTPVELVYSETFGSRSAAMRREHEIKQRSRTAKERLVYGGRDGEADVYADAETAVDTDGAADADAATDVDVD